MAHVTEEDVVAFQGLPESIDLDGDIVIRRYTVEDLPDVVDALNATLATLRPWMPWAQEPLTLESQSEWLREADEMWEAGTGFGYGVFDTDGKVLGGVGYHVRNGPGVLEIGYWLGSAYEGRGIMTRVASALTAAGRQVPGVTSIHIHCDVANVRSAAIPRRLGSWRRGGRGGERGRPASTGRHPN